MSKQLDELGGSCIIEGVKGRRESDYDGYEDYYTGKRMDGI